MKRNILLLIISTFSIYAQAQTPDHKLLEGRWRIFSVADGQGGHRAYADSLQRDLALVESAWQERKARYVMAASMDSMGSKQRESDEAAKYEAQDSLRMIKDMTTALSNLRQSYMDFGSDGQIKGKDNIDTYNGDLATCDGTYEWIDIEHLRIKLPARTREYKVVFVGTARMILSTGQSESDMMIVLDKMK